MKNRTDQVWKKSNFSHMLSKVTPQRGAKAVVREFGNSGFSFNKTPEYLSVVIRRRGASELRLAV